MDFVKVIEDALAWKHRKIAVKYNLAMLIKLILPPYVRLNFVKEIFK